MFKNKFLDVKHSCPNILATSIAGICMLAIVFKKCIPPQKNKKIINKPRCLDCPESACLDLYFFRFNIYKFIIISNKHFNIY